MLGGDSEVLDLGRKTAQWSPAQRRALRLEDGPTCRWPGCTVPNRRCRIHHVDHHARGGATDVRNGVHLCRFHHYCVHERGWDIAKDHRGRVQVRRS